MGLYRDVLSPAIPVLARLEERGIPLDIKTRNTLREETQARLDVASARIGILAQEMHQSRRDRIAREIKKTEDSRAAYLSALPSCPEHPHYRGTGRTFGKRECCRKFYDEADGARTWLEANKVLRTRLKNKREQIGETFDAKNNHHWRFLLFDELGLNLEPATYTETTQTPKVDEDAIQKLQRRYPDVELLRLRVDISETVTRLTTRLAVEPGPDGRVHTPYSLHRTWNQRISSGADESEAENARDGAGNMQNVPKRDRKMYRAEPGHWFIQPDLSQVEARVQAWIARDIKMLSAWRDGLDIHAMTAAAIYNVPEAETKIRLVKIGGTMEPMRQMGKRRRHGGNYGMGDRKFADMTGITLAEAQRISAMDRVVWPRLYAFQKEEVQRATVNKLLRNEFGKVVRFYRFRQRGGQWEIEDREEALSFRPASDVACMIIQMLPEVDAIEEGELLTTTHDSYLIQIPQDLAIAERVVSRVETIMSKEWEQFGLIPEFGYFRCPVDVKIGLNWGDQHLCKPKMINGVLTPCPNRRDPERPCDDFNEDGLEDFKPWLEKRRAA